MCSPCTPCLHPSQFHARLLLLPGAPCSFPLTIVLLMHHGLAQVLSLLPRPCCSPAVIHAAPSPAPQSSVSCVTAFVHSAFVEEECTVSLYPHTQHSNTGCVLSSPQHSCPFSETSGMSHSSVQFQHHPPGGGVRSHRLKAPSCETVPHQRPVTSPRLSSVFLTNCL